MPENKKLFIQEYLDLCKKYDCHIGVGAGNLYAYNGPGVTGEYDYLETIKRQLKDE